MRYDPLLRVKLTVRTVIDVCIRQFVEEGDPSTISISTVCSVSEFNISHYQYGIRRANFDLIIDRRTPESDSRVNKELAFRRDVQRCL